MAQTELHLSSNWVELTKYTSRSSILIIRMEYIMIIIFLQKKEKNKTSKVFTQGYTCFL